MMRRMFHEKKNIKNMQPEFFPFSILFTRKRAMTTNKKNINLNLNFLPNFMFLFQHTLVKERRYLLKERATLLRSF